MTTSGSTNFSYNRDQIIRSAARKIGAFAAGETPDAQTVQDFSDALNAMVKEWDARGIHVWTETEATLFLQPNQVQYALGPSSPDNATETWYSTTLAVDANTGETTVTVDSDDDITNGDYIGIVLDDGSLYWTTVNGVPASDVVTLTGALTGAASGGNAVYNYTTQIIRPLRVPFARRYAIQSQIDTPMIAMSRKDYRDLPNKTNTGTITQFFYDPQLGTGYFYVWPAPVDTTSAVHFTWYRTIQDFDTAGNTPDLPQEWISTLVFNLAKEMALEYDCPPERYAIIKSEAAEKLDMLSGWDREPESTYFGVDFTQMGYGP